jgi:hypothetical protein
MTAAHLQWLKGGLTHATGKELNMQFDDEDESEQALIEYRRSLEATKRLPRRKAAPYLTRKSLDRSFADLYAKWLKPLTDEIGKLQKRVAELEAARSTPPIKYLGIWKQDTEYKPGNTVTWGGSMWHANTVSKGLKPGDGNTEWTLCVKRGRDGRDGGAK